ncbi:Universal stress protein UspA-like protein [Croceitalea dokdonensis DOKDO 023]|uniref:Universal stress protein UspA-like protein n=1 Tax=Croceitalea dokdonensis DOKDO 023 TaxID=1300341 RepID=A0A0P7A348_9FLAO|nr:universal stress protein [Croceitalea dokdonensis]KPM30875.1 Universal stress protein UspA-like protein [Croceitalea dokdonensis DOKDO 023]
MDKVLVPVDFSDTSANALRYAAQLFAGSPMEITLLHTYGVQSSGALLMKNIDGVLLKDAKEKMNNLLKASKEDFPDVVLHTKLVKGSAVATIVSLAKEGGFNFIVMGTKGASGLKEVFMGSVAGGVVSKSSTPIIVVPGNHHFRKLDQIVYAVGDKLLSDPKIVAPLRKIATLHKSKIKVLHVAQGKAKKIETSLIGIEDLNPSVEYTFGSGNIHKDLNDYLMKDYSGLLCMVREKKGMLERLLDGSVTLKQTFDSLVPLLILHD